MHQKAQELIQHSWVAIALAGLFLALPAWSQTPDTTRQPGTTSPEMSELARNYNVQESEILNLRDKGWSWNEIGNALAISKRSGRPMQEVVNQRDSGVGWNQIASQYGFKFSEVSREARQVAKKGSRADKNRKETEAIQRDTGAEGRDRETGRGTTEDRGPSSERGSDMGGERPESTFPENEPAPGAPTPGGGTTP
ncbi:MAG: hypothetical protein HY549_03005 [Elusimicrobia bacterium]|nr:hypothetical protein [Elusimicrobiota bacterium]